MKFVTTQDIDVLIRADMLQHLIGSDTQLLGKAESAAIQKISNYLNTRYNTQKVFAAKGTDRDELLLMYVIDVMLYDLHSRINPRKIPELRRTRYNEVIQWLTDIQAGKIHPDLPELTAPNHTNGQSPNHPNHPNHPTASLTKIRWGSNTKREHYY